MLQILSRKHSLRLSREARACIENDGIVLMHLARGLLFSANRIGARIWQGLDKGHSIGGIAAAISQEYGIRVDISEQDCIEFCQDLCDSGLAAVRES